MYALTVQQVLIFPRQVLAPPAPVIVLLVRLHRGAVSVLLATIANRPVHAQHALQLYLPALPAQVPLYALTVQPVLIFLHQVLAPPAPVIVLLVRLHWGAVSVLLATIANRPVHACHAQTLMLIALPALMLAHAPTAKQITIFPHQPLAHPAPVIVLLVRLHRGAVSVLLATIANQPLYAQFAQFHTVKPALVQRFVLVVLFLIILVLMVLAISRVQQDILN